MNSTRRHLGKLLMGGAAVLPGSALLAQAINGVPNQQIQSPANIYYVGLSGCPYTTIAQALAAINAGAAPTSANPAVIFMYPGTYTMTSTLTIPQFVGIMGVEKWYPVVLHNDSGDMFSCSGFNWFQNLTIRQGAAASSTVFQCGNNTDISVLDCNMFPTSGGANLQAFVVAQGASWARITIQDCTVNSFLTSGYICFFNNTSTSPRFCDTWISRCFFDSYQLTNFGGEIMLNGVQDFRVEYCVLRGANTWNTSISNNQGALTSGSAQVEIRQCYTTGAVSVFGATGTTTVIINSDCAGAALPGTNIVHNSYVGAAYNPLGPI